MPIPFILGGAALLLGGYGIKKGIDAKDDFDEAKRYNEKAKNIYNKAKEKLENDRNRTNSHLESLGKLKLSIYEGSLNDFVNLYSQIKNVDFKNNLNLGLLNNVDEQDMLDIKNTVLEIQEVLGGGIAALGSGALAGFGALGGVGMLASASTGTAIASLSGAAATNATLAWLGGGSLAAGGFGMAGGMAVLGGIVLGPALAVGGILMGFKAEEAKYTAYENYDKAKAAAEEMDVACVALDGIYKRVDEFIDILVPLNKYLYQFNNQMNIIINNNTNLFQKLLRASYKKFKESDKKIMIIETIVETAWFQKLLKVNYQKFKESDKKKIMITVSIAQTVKNLCDAPIIDENGVVTKQSKEVLKKAKELTQKLSEV